MKPALKTVLVTGGAGFLGSHFCEFLLAKGYRVICMDNLITGSTTNIQHLTSHKQFRFVKHDVTQHISVAEEIHYILHFASPASPIDYLKLPIQTLKVGALGTHNALGLAKAKKAVFMLSSTSEVYGDPLVSPQKESYWGNVNPIGPRGVYDEAKRFAEALTMAYHRVHKIPVRIARIFNTYGPRMRKDDGRAIPNFITQALANKAVTVYGDGSQTRSFSYVADEIDGLYRLMLSDVNEPVNIGNPQELTLLEIAQQIVALTKSKSKITFAPLPVDDPKVRKPDITLAQQKLGWKPTTTLEEGLQKTIAFFQQQHAKNPLH
ncbi:SDR family oxidoreductase [Candidatus Woesearchaeota archaeon]|nr:SDR family oxidoreductase [Candidatus Woesearchaeota archaeon]